MLHVPAAGCGGADDGRGSLGRGLRGLEQMAFKLIVVLGDMAVGRMALDEDNQHAGRQQM